MKTVLLPLALVGLLAQHAAHAQEQQIRRLPSTLYLPRAASSTALPASAAFGAVKDIQILNKPNMSSVLQNTASSALSNVTKQFLQSNAAELGLQGNATEFRINNARETLTGKYVDVEQRLNGLRVLDGHIQINVAPDGEVKSVSRNVVAIPNNKSGSVPKTAKLEPKQARDTAWQDLGATGELLEPVSVERAYYNENNVLTLVYVVRVAVSAPLGYWEYLVDANSGRIVSKRDRRVQEEKSKRAIPASAAADAPAVPIESRIKAFEQKNKAAAAEKSAAKNASFATGEAMVFVPNPISTLSDASLRDGDPPARFEKAYVKVTLDGLRKLGSVLTLNGEIVRIEDFEPGATGSQPPSTAAAAWDAHRGNNAFNDVNTYFHIHNNLMYLRKLGYSGSKDLFPNGISVDTDGLGGADNSHYVPGSDRIAFGHGCVDDNEDSDVILHELAHAIHNHVNPRWSGGDSGAIGEGFGDYWAVSHRLRMKNGLTVDAGKVFVWDASEGCWTGRRADRTTARYQSNRTYGAHQDMGGFESDELWSTPLVGALRELLAAGESAESVDVVVLEGMAAVGTNFTMRSLALKTVEQAKGMHPGKPHAAVLEKHFKAMGILE